MHLLAFDTSGPTCAVAVAHDACVLAEDHAETGARHGEVLLPRIQSVLGAASVTLAQLDLVVVGVGPGSFTGLRIGLSTAKGLALGTGVALRGVCSLQVVARAVTEQATTAIVVMDAGKSQVFAAVYERSGDVLRMLLPPHLTAPEDAARNVAALGLSDAMLCGSGARLHAAAMSPLLAQGVKLCARDVDMPQGRHVAQAGRLAWLAQGPSDLGTLEPTYLRGSDAKLPASPLAL
jgi:tRNA threonylcarbamoyladenosine biosynthesis protein TsaB